METGGSAFPVSDFDKGGNTRTSNNKGMDLRDYFAAAALPGIMARVPTGNPGVPGNGTIQEQVAAAAYAQADAMIKARQQ